VLVSGSSGSMKPGRPLRLVRPTGPSEPPSLDDLRSAAPPELALDAVTRLFTALDDQPSLTGDPASVKAALEAYWKGELGREPAFSAGMASFFALAADEEGLWAYTRLATAAHVFDRLALEEPRRPDGMTAEHILLSRLLVAAA